MQKRREYMRVLMVYLAFQKRVVWTIRPFTSSRAK